MIMKIKRIDHIGVVVNDIEPAKEFFLDFGLNQCVRKILPWGTMAKFFSVYMCIYS